jgi:hypothetical protein
MWRVRTWKRLFRAPDPVISSIAQVSYLSAWLAPFDSSLALKISNLILTKRDFTTDELDYWALDVVYISLGFYGYHPLYRLAFDF